MINILGRRGFMHGCDYYPEQWEETPEVIDEDCRLMRQAGVNTVALGIFAWSRLEPSDGRYELDWMERVIDKLYACGISVWLATPSGAKPNWLALSCEEVRRCQANGQRDPQSSRHNHCPTSPLYRSKVTAINERLSRRFGRHPAVSLWHISNEYSGVCYCPLCFSAFHKWLEAKYEDVDTMNKAWWTRFWSHTYDRFDQVTYIDGTVSGLLLDWKRFVSDQTVDFMRTEVAALRPYSDRPVTSNTMGFYEVIDYGRLAVACDVIGWDAYPDWHGHMRCSNDNEKLRPAFNISGDALVASEVAFLHDLNRCLKNGQPWLLMESTPSNLNWRSISRLKEPGVNRIAGLQAVAHGADAIAYFQWRKSRGGIEAFHGAVVDHVGHGETRVFREISDLSGCLSKIAHIAGTRITNQVAITYDWEVRWHQDLWKHARNVDKDYAGNCVQYYNPLWRRSIGCDIIDCEMALDRYKLVIAPSLYMLRPGQAERLSAFVADGGTLVCTAPCGVVDHQDLAYTSGRPGPLRQLLGVWAEEMDANDDGTITLQPAAGDPLGLGIQFGGGICELLHAEGAEVLSVYAGTWYAGRPALTRRRHGRGWAYYLGTRGTPALLDCLIGRITNAMEIVPVLTGLPSPVVAHRRGDVVFLFNWGRDARKVDLSRPTYEVLSEYTSTSINLPGWGVAVLADCGQSPIGLPGGRNDVPKA